MLIGVAVKYDEITVLLPKPNRHYMAHAHALKTLGLKPQNNTDLASEGFYTSTGQFFNRRDAVAYARECGQIPRLAQPTSLTSQHLW